MSEQRYVVFERGDIAQGQAQLIIGFKTPDGHREMLRGDVPMLFARRLFSEGLKQFEKVAGELRQSTEEGVEQRKELEAFDALAPRFDINVEKAYLNPEGYKYEHTGYLFNVFKAGRAQLREELAAVVAERTELESAVVEAGMAAGVYDGKESLDTAQLIALVHKLAVEAAANKKAIQVLQDLVETAPDVPKGCGGYRRLKGSPTELIAQVDEALAGMPKRAEDLLEGPTEWTPLTGPGQIGPGYELRFQSGDETFTKRARLVKYRGTPEEEVIYDMQKNFYFIVNMAVAGNSHAKNIEYRRPSSKG